MLDRTVANATRGGDIQAARAVAQQPASTMKPF